MLRPPYLTESTFRVRAILGRAILGRAILGRAILGRAILGRAILGRAVAANRPRDSDSNTLL